MYLLQTPFSFSTHSNVEGKEAIPQRSTRYAAQDLELCCRIRVGDIHSPHVAFGQSRGEDSGSLRSITGDQNSTSVNIFLGLPQSGPHCSGLAFQLVGLAEFTPLKGSGSSDRTRVPQLNQRTSETWAPELPTGLKRLRRSHNPTTLAKPRRSPPLPASSTPYAPSFDSLPASHVAGAPQRRDRCRILESFRHRARRSTLRGGTRDGLPLPFFP